MKTISLEFEGYWCEYAKSAIPSKSGIYCVYACYDINESRLSVQRLLYIGESSDVNERLSNHERLPDWLDELESEEVLCYSFAPVSKIDRERAEAALIFKCQPPMNDEHKRRFSYEDTEIVATGNTAKLQTNFKLYKDSTL